MTDPQMNFFTEELHQYYLEHGVTLSPEILTVLSKSPMELTDNEKGLFVRFILPRRHQIKQALRTRFTRSGEDRQQWTASIIYSQSVIGQIACEILIEEEVTALGPGLLSLPVMVGPLSAPQPASTSQASPAIRTKVLKERRARAWLDSQALNPQSDGPRKPPPSLQLEVGIPTLRPGQSPPSSSPLFGPNIRKGSRQIFKRKRRMAGYAIAGGALLLLLLLLAFLSSSWGKDLFKHNQQLVAASARVEKTAVASAPTIGIIVDDVGASIESLDQWLAVDAPLTFSILPRLAHSEELAQQLYAAGYRIMLNVPTEGTPPHEWSGEGQISKDMEQATVLRMLDDDLVTVPHSTGMNNHEGQVGCADLQLMMWQCGWAKANNLFVLDSRTARYSMVSTAAEAVGLEKKYNQVFIDEHNDADFIHVAMGQLANIARSNGVAIGICNFSRSNTPAVLAETIKELRQEGINFAFVQDLKN